MKFKCAVFLLIFTFTAQASVRIEEELFIPRQTPQIIKELLQVGSVEVDHVTREGFELYGSKGLKKYLDSKNIFYLDMKVRNKSEFKNYPTSLQVAKKLESLVAKFSDIMRLVKIGESVKGNDLIFIKISDNVNKNEVEPEFKYISSMHGDEITGRELTVKLIEEIGNKYGKDKEITDLVNNTELFIMPSMNPDGSDLKQRANANGYDLNRNFPDITRDTQSSPAGRQIENQAVMKFQNERQFALSANFHGGTIVMNYPWDSKYELHPLDSLIKGFSKGYADLNPGMRDSEEFPGGITNGAAWYVVKGGMQDWSYFWHNDLQVTIELSHDKWPTFSDIPGLYKDNRDSMIYFMKQIHHGAGFKIARPDIQGTVEIKKVGAKTKSLGSFAFKDSEFYKVMPAGDYTFRIKEKSKKIMDVSVRVEEDVINPNGNYAFLD